MQTIYKLHITSVAGVNSVVPGDHFYPGSVLFAKSTPYKAFTGADPGFLDGGFKFTRAGGGGGGGVGGCWGVDLFILHDYL